MEFDLLESRLESLLSGREPPKTICPSEVARSMSACELKDLGVSSWRDLMPRIRELLWAMRDEGKAEILQKGVALPQDTKLDQVKGPIRARKT